jgi:hypothetical protein
MAAVVVISGNQPLAIVAGANPEPDNFIAVFPAKHTVGTVYDGGVDAAHWADRLEVQAPVRRVVSEHPVGLPELKAHVPGKLIVAFEKSLV